MYPVYIIQISKQIFQRGPSTPTLKKEYLKQIFDSQGPFRLPLQIQIEHNRFHANVSITFQ